MQAIRRLLVLLVILAPIAVGRAQTVVDFATTTPTGVQAHTVAFQNLTTTTAVNQAWFWDFGDGSVGSSAKSPTHTYNSSGSYTVTLFVFPLLEPQVSATKPDFIVVTPAVLDVDFTTSVTSGTAPLEVAFSGTAVGTGSITDWHWTFGDGQTASGQDVVHTYTQVGKRTVTLEVSAGDPVASVTKTDLIEILPPDLQPSFTLEPSEGYAPLEVHFTDTSTGLHDMWEWSFDDSPTTPWWGLLENPTHVYKVPGVYDVTLTIGFDGSTASVTLPGAVTVIDPALEPAMSVFPRGGLSPLSVTFTDASTSEVPYTSQLDYDDFSSFGHADSTHVYTGTRWFSPTLRITTSPIPKYAETTSWNAVECVDPEVATFVSYSEPELSFLGVPATDLTVADFSGDGLPDLLVEIPYQPVDPDQGFSVFVQTGGSFQTIAKTFAPTHHNPFRPDVSGIADMDEDGVLDIVLVPWNDPAAPVSTWRGDGAGGFALQSETPLPDTPAAGSTEARWSAVLDVDDDGHVDVVVGAEDMLTIFRGDGLGGFASVSPPGVTVRFDGNPTVVDVDLDGHEDLVGRVMFDKVSWLAGDGLGFGPPVDVFYGDSALQVSLDVGDVTGDGLVDLVLPSYPDILIARGTGVGFDDFVVQGTPHPSGAPMRLGDVDGDGRADMLSAYGHDVRLTRFDQDGGVGFASGLAWHPAASDASALRLVDVDADGDLDVLMSYSHLGGTQKVVTVHRNLGIIGRWVDIGGEMTGAAGELHLEGRGELRRGTRVVLELTGAAPASPAFLVVGLSDVMQPFAGGVLVPALDALIVGVTDALGEAEWLAKWPGNVPAMTPNWYQAWVVEGGVFVGSNGLLSIAAE